MHGMLVESGCKVIAMAAEIHVAAPDAANMHSATQGLAAETADVSTATKASHVAAAETSAVTATTTTAASCLGRGREQA